MLYRWCSHFRAHETTQCEHCVNRWWRRSPCAAQWHAGIVVQDSLVLQMGAADGMRETSRNWARRTSRIPCYWDVLFDNIIPMIQIYSNIFKYIQIYSNIWSNIIHVYIYIERESVQTTCYILVMIGVCHGINFQGHSLTLWPLTCESQASLHSPGLKALSNSELVGQSRLAHRIESAWHAAALCCCPWCRTHCICAFA